jgi:hypothetical protein
VYTADAYLGVQVLRVDRAVDPHGMPRLTAPVPSVWFATSAAYLPADTWGFSCPYVDVAVA